MKKIIACFTAIFIAGSQLLAQDKNTQKNDDAKFKERELEKFLSTLLSINAEAPAGAVYIDVSKDPLIKLNLPLRKIDTKKNYFAFFESKFTSTNNYVPILRKGKWQPDIELLFSQTWMPLKQRFFYTTDIRQFEAAKALGAGSGLKLMPISEASFIRFGWFNLKTGFNFRKFGLFNDGQTIPYEDRVFDKETTGFVMKVSGNLYLLKRLYNKTTHIGFYAKVGYELNTKDNNYSTLEKTLIKVMQKYTDANGEYYEETKDEMDLRKGVFKTGVSHNFPFNATLIFNPGNIDFNLNLYGSHKIFDALNTTDVGISLFFPIPKDEDGKSSINIGLKFDFPDVRNQVSVLPIKEKIKFGIALAVPIIPAVKK
jgi:hypothetical protein